MTRPTHCFIAIAIAILVIVAVLASGCGSPPPPGVDYTLHVSNGTTMALAVSVNGQGLEIVPEGPTDVDYDVGQLPRLPWAVEVRTIPGRLLLTLKVRFGDVVDVLNADGSRTRSAPGARVDLSCGRLDLYVGSVPMIGPAPGPGVPGDCVP